MNISTKKISPNLKLRQVFILPCPLEDHDMFLETKLDDGNISLIGRVLEIKAYELFLLPSFVKPILEIGKKTRHLSAVVRVHDIEIGGAMCKYLPVASDRWWIHGGRNRMGMEGEEEERRGREMAAVTVAIVFPCFDRANGREANGLAFSPGL